MADRIARAVFCAGAVLTSASCNALLGPSPTDADWVTSDRGHYTFYVRAGSFAEQSLDTLAAVLEDQFAVTVRAIEGRYDGRIAMFLHNSGAEAGFASDGNGGNHSGVAYPETETVKTVAVPPLDANLFSLLSHEANHVIVRNSLGREGTSFITEGIASALLSERFHSQGRTFLYHWTAVNRSQLIRLATLVDDGRWNSVSSQFAYNESASFLAYLLDTYGQRPFRAIYSVTSSEFASAFRAAYGMSLESAEEAWIAFCVQRG
jgi:hypothetical protein